MIIREVLRMNVFSMIDKVVQQYLLNLPRTKVFTAMVLASHLYFYNSINSHLLFSRCYRTVGRLQHELYMSRDV